MYGRKAQEHYYHVVTVVDTDHLSRYTEDVPEINLHYVTDS